MCDHDFVKHSRYGVGICQKCGLYTPFSHTVTRYKNGSTLGYRAYSAKKAKELQTFNIRDLLFNKDYIKTFELA